MQINEKVKIITIDDFKLAYEVYGEGGNVILCFHGNSRSAEDFKFLSNKNRKIISVHLFMHHYSTFSPQRIEKGNVYPADIKKLIEKILINEKVDQFHLVAYSQGGRFAFNILPKFANRVKSFYLISPDGLNNNNFYSWSQRRWWARKLFKRWIKKPNELMLIARVLVKLKIISPKIREFLGTYTSDPEKMKTAFETWSSFRNLTTPKDSIKKILEQQPIHFKVIVGRYDAVITVKSAAQFLKEINQLEALIICEFGHNIFKPHIENELLELLDFEDELN